MKQGEPSALGHCQARSKRLMEIQMRLTFSLLIFLLCLMPFPSRIAHAFETSDIGFPLPTVDKNTVSRGRARFDATDRIEGKETVVSSFMNLDVNDTDYLGFKVWSIAGFPFAYLVNAKGKVNGKVTYGYTLLDNDGDGIFETKYAANEKFDIPEWVIQKALEGGALAPPSKQ